MKTKTTITEITHEDLVNLLCTATEGSSWLETGTTVKVRERIGIDPDECSEDLQARALIAGHTIVATDYYAEGEKYGGKCLVTFDDDRNARYHLTLERIKEGIAAAIDGTFKTNGDPEIDFAATSARQFIDDCRDYSSEFDLAAADCLMQIIMFNEIIYG